MQAELKENTRCQATHFNYYTVYAFRVYLLTLYTGVYILTLYTGIILGKDSANERRRS